MLLWILISLLLLNLASMLLLQSPVSNLKVRLASLLVLLVAFILNTVLILFAVYALMPKILSLSS